ncbi:hypothetical protein D3C72_2537670 [compost metagenome]
MIFTEDGNLFFKPSRGVISLFVLTPAPNPPKAFFFVALFPMTAIDFTPSSFKGNALFSFFNKTIASAAIL